MAENEMCISNITYVTILPDMVCSTHIKILEIKNIYLSIFAAVNCCMQYVI